MPRILCLESDSGTREKISSALSTLGYCATAVARVDEAREKGNNFDLFLCDSTMDGLHFALEMREMKKKVLIIAPLRKFSRLPYFNSSQLEDKKAFRNRIKSLHLRDT